MLAVTALKEAATAGTDLLVAMLLLSVLLSVVLVVEAAGMVLQAAATRKAVAGMALALATAVHKEVDTGVLKGQDMETLRAVATDTAVLKLWELNKINKSQIGSLAEERDRALTTARIRIAN